MSANTLPAIPFFQNMWPGAGGNGLTPTQVWANDYISNSAIGDATNTLNNADNAANFINSCPTTFTSKGAVKNISCGKYGPWMVFNPQFSALSAWSSLGKGDYHALQVTLRKRFSYGLQFDLNYTWSKSIDLGSNQEASGSFGGAGGASAGFVENTWNPSQMRAVSGYDTTHQLNSYGEYELPFGRGRKFGTNMNKILDALVGGWQVSGTYRQTSGLPFTVGNGQRWPSDWNANANATPITAIPVSITENATGIKNGGPNLFQNPLAIVTAAGAQRGQYGLFVETLAGQSGVRNNIRGPGFFNIDSGLYKVFKMPYSEHHQIQIRWETFNVTNSVRFTTASLTDNSSSSFGKFSGTLTQPRQMQIAGRYTW